MADRAAHRSVLSFLSKIRHLSLTSVDIGAHEVGRRVTRALLDRIADPKREAVEYQVTPTLEVRGSTGPAPMKRHPSRQRTSLSPAQQPA
ncbi:substrate-binding domain-containing protein [Streptomyces sp. NPDC093591]|uniref:substrate-binding domain-containing protein n=1 Tax=Streptomyces sp. NPDC093591 TaxID=3366044 RepID=UPI003816DDE2